MKIRVFSEESIEQFKTDNDHIVISVHSPKTNPVKLPLQKSRLDSLFLAFHDIDEGALDITKRKDCNMCEGTGYIKKWRHIENGRCFKCNREGMDLRLFGNKDAEKILNFVNEYIEKIDLIAVNCEAGISRSSGISAALSLIFNGKGTDEYYFKNYLPNTLVYRKILEAYYKVCYICTESIDIFKPYIALFKDPKTGKQLYKHMKCKDSTPLKPIKRK